MASEISQISDSSIVIIQGTVALYTVTTRCHTYFAVTLKYTEDSSLIMSMTLFDYSLCLIKVDVETKTTQICSPQVVSIFFTGICLSMGGGGLHP